MLFQPWNWYRENYSIVQSQTRDIKQLHYNQHYTDIGTICQSNILGYGYWCLAPLSTICQIYRGGQCCWLKETGVPRENLRPASHWQTLSHNVVLSTPAWAGFEFTTLVVIETYCTGSCKSKYHAITTRTTPQIL